MTTHKILSLFESPSTELLESITARPWDACGNVMQADAVKTCHRVLKVLKSHAGSQSDSGLTRTTDAQAHTIDCSDSWMKAQGLPTYSDLRAEISRLTSIVNMPETHDFVKAILREAEHAAARNADFDLEKTPFYWFKLVRWLGSKAVKAFTRGDTEKEKHHIITTAAACYNWYRARFDRRNTSPLAATAGAGKLDDIAARVEQLEQALVYVAHSMHSEPQYMLAEGITLGDANYVRVQVGDVDIAVQIPEASARALFDMARQTSVEKSSRRRALLAPHTHDGEASK